MNENKFTLGVDSVKLRCHLYFMNIPKTILSLSSPPQKIGVRQADINQQNMRIAKNKVSNLEKLWRTCLRQLLGNILRMQTHLLKLQIAKTV